MKKLIFIYYALLYSLITYGTDFQKNGLSFMTFGNGELMVTGMVDKNIKNVIIPTLIEYDSNIYTVTGISYNAFKDCDNIIYVELSDSLTHIGDCAFANCI